MHKFRAIIYSAWRRPIHIRQEKLFVLVIYKKNKNHLQKVKSQKKNDRNIRGWSKNGKVNKQLSLFQLVDIVGDQRR